MTSSRFHCWFQVCSGTSNGADVYPATRNIDPRRLPWTTFERNEIAPARERYAAAGATFSGILWMPQGYLAAELKPADLLPFDQWSLSDSCIAVRDGFTHINDFGLLIYTGCIDSERGSRSLGAWVRENAKPYRRFGLIVDKATGYDPADPQFQALKRLAMSMLLGVEGSTDAAGIRRFRDAGILRWLVTQESAAPNELTGGKMPETVRAANELARAEALRVGVRPIMLCRTPEVLKWAYDKGWHAAAELKVLDASGMRLEDWGVV